MKKLKHYIKSQIPNPNLQTNPKSQIPKFQIKKFWSLAIWSLVIVCNLVLGVWNLTYLYAEDKIIAIVNYDVITQKDLNDFTSFMAMQLSREYKGRELEERIQSMKLDLLDKLIEDRLILQEAKKNNIRVDESRVKARINEIKKHYNSDTEFKNDLAKQGLTQADIESRVREQLLMYNIVEYMVKDKIVVRPDEVTSFYDKNKKELVSDEERELEAITLESEDLAKTVSYELRTGQKLVDLATKYSLTVNTIKAGQGELRKDIEDVVFKLGISEISNPLKIDDRYCVFKLNNIIPARHLILSEAQDKIYAFLFEKKMQEKLTKWLDELKQKSYIKILQN